MDEANLSSVIGNWNSNDEQQVTTKQPETNLEEINGASNVPEWGLLLTPESSLPSDHGGMPSVFVPADINWGSLQMDGFGAERLPLTIDSLDYRSSGFPASAPQASLGFCPTGYLQTDQRYLYGPSNATGSGFATEAIPPSLRLLQPSVLSQPNAICILEVLRTYPTRMTSRETFPPFIHSCWGKRAPDGTLGELPQPIASCMSVSQLFAARNPETLGFLWRAIEVEQKAFFENSYRYSRQDLIAAIQALMIYFLMRAAHDGFTDCKVEYQMLMTFEFLVLKFQAQMGDHESREFAVIEADNSNSSWEDWISAESRRRIACYWFLISHVVDLKIINTCQLLKSFQTLPLPSPQVLWEAKDSYEWKEASSTVGRRESWRFRTIKDLANYIQPEATSPASYTILNTWNSETDQLGFLLAMATTLNE
ncbi:hypothetical protein O1611_g1891 [Lasiodiplodia mahajangana]|uniref:Uncharacterized protein n=1 Tax=Lasiodiplodia mahajangana TaxID=1108764 RepID=A0ACC2JWZ7_9PEZI|nr:hypothetical protein O1611_g1891 [Lasiodiplodia mahajangana]